MRKSFYLSYLLAITIFNYNYGQTKVEYKIDADLNLENETIIVSQTITFINALESETNIIYLYDWSNAYKDPKTPLSLRLAEEYNRSFYLSSKSKRGYTKIDSLTNKNIDLVWLRENEHPDIIKVFLPEYLKQNEKTSIELKYIIKLPDQKFTGFGIKSNSNINLRYWYISLAPYINKNWILHSDLDINDNSILPSDYYVNWRYPEDIKVVSNLNHTDSYKTEDQRKTSFTGLKQTRAQFVFNTKSDFKIISTENGKKIISNIETKSIDKSQLIESQNRIENFISSFLKPYPHEKILILKNDYDKNPFYGLNQLPKFLNIYSDKFYYEIKFLKAYLDNYLNEILPINKRKHHWVIGGLQTYLMIKYVEKFYPNEKLLGELSNSYLLRSFRLSSLKFNEGYQFFYEFSLRSNLQQSDIESKEKLIRLNEKIASPYHVGIGFNYLDRYLGGDTFNSYLREYIYKSDKVNLKDFINNKTKNKTDWFFNDYLKLRTPYDLSIKNIIKSEKNISFTLSEKSNRSLPVSVGLILKDSIVNVKWLELKGKDTIITLKNSSSSYLSINPGVDFPEINKNNNWKRINTAFGLKPLKFNFLKDIEDPKRNQVFYNPVFNFNAYDGLSVGMRLFNKKIKSQPFIMDFFPQYTFVEDSWVGSFKSVLKIYDDQKNNYLTQFQVLGSSYHYNSNHRYSVIVPSISWFFRTDSFRSNKKEMINLSWYKVFRERDINIEANPDYSILNLKHVYSNQGAINYLTNKTSFEFSNHLGKVHLTSDFRKLFPSGRQVGVRLFAGKFLWNNNYGNGFFDFNLNKPSDYLFQYNYLGRSEETGLYSQQYIAAEGGFKSKFSQSLANDFMISSNLYIGIWKWIEFYSDIGVLKNKNTKAIGYYDTGFRINLVPDYLELYFPLVSSNGWEIFQNKYSSKIRFVVLLEPRTLTSLITRKWF